MIYEVSGDILLSKAQAIAHGVAPNDDFKNGLALSLRERWPAMYKDFRHYCKTYHPEAGNLWTWRGAGGPIIINLLTQEAAYDHGGHPGEATLHNVNQCLRNLEKEIKKENLASIALPRLATGVGGLEWSDVRPLIETHFGNIDIPVILYTEFHSGLVAHESAARL
ncbi:MAG: macro domain-containing protein [Deltaproteobacteria bacterium]|nr:macro domain-containing protein [Deltaproteobacteria bacterium]